ncbi:MAG: hypothetical protein PHF50_00010 [Patescibacteria group bacterium]|nr:hypothetical protein [Patescibacteria group bacterium]
MKNGSWALEFTLRYKGSTSFGEPVEGSEDVVIEISAKDEQSAEQQALAFINLLKNAASEESRKMITNLCGLLPNLLDDEDSVEFSEPCLVYCAEKSLGIQIPLIPGGG